MNENIKIQDIAGVIKRHIFMILLIPLVCVCLTGFISYFLLTPVYEASTQLLINQKQSDKNNESTIDVQTNLELINTYNVIIKSKAILELVNEDLKLNMSASELSKHVKVSNEQNSQVVTIAVQNADHQLAAEIANKIATIFRREVQEIMNIDNVTILSKASIADGSKPVKPQPVLNMAIVFITSLLVMFGIVLLLEFLDNTIKSEKDISSYLQMPVLGSIPVVTLENLSNTNRVQHKRKGRSK